tara:strand:- start:67346 stop:67843 length:498 start_codon:yes stop_codon:yes gene_type:complete
MTAPKGTTFRQVWLEHRYPEQFSQQARGRARKAVQLALEGRAVDTLDKTGREQWAAEIEAYYDTSVLDDLGLSAGQLLEMQGREGERRRGGEVRAKQREADKMAAAAKAFASAEREGMDYRQALDHAQNFCDTSLAADTQIKRTVLSRWLDQITGPPWSSIPPKK